MNNSTSARPITSLRQDAQSLQKSIRENVNADERKAKVAIEKAVSAAQQLQVRLTEAAAVEGAEGKARLQEAAARLSASAAIGLAAIETDGAELEIKVREMAQDSRAALDRITEVVAARRANQKK